MKAGSVGSFLVAVVAWITFVPLAGGPCPVGAAEPAADLASSPASPLAESAPGEEPGGAPPPEAGEIETLPESAPEQGVALAQFTTAVEDREPVDAIAFLENEARDIVFYSDLRGYAGETITHRWEYQDQVMAEVPFVVRGNRWRVWSSKQLLPAWIGDWTVSVVKADGEVIAAESFSYNEPL